MSGNHISSVRTAPRPLLSSPDGHVEPCPRCRRNGRRFGERPINGRLTWHCAACGRVWQASGATMEVAFPTVVSDSAVAVDKAQLRDKRIGELGNPADTARA